MLYYGVREFHNLDAVLQRAAGTLIAYPAAPENDPELKAAKSMGLAEWFQHRADVQAGGGGAGKLTIAPAPSS